MDELELAYQEIIRPSNLLKLSEVEGWLDGHPAEDVAAFIEAAVRWEDYEHAAIGLKVLKRIS